MFHHLTILILLLKEWVNVVAYPSMRKEINIKGEWVLFTKGGNYAWVSISSLFLIFLIITFLLNRMWCKFHYKLHCSEQHNIGYLSVKLE